MIKNSITITSPLNISGNKISFSEKIKSDDLSIIGLESMNANSEFQFQDGKIKSLTVNPSQEDWQKLIELSSGGIGVTLEPTDQGMRIKEIAKNSPASEAGLKTRDLIVAVDKISYFQMRPGEINLRIRGPVDSKVVLSVLHEGSTTPVDIQVTRASLAQLSN